VKASASSKGPTLWRAPSPRASSSKRSTSTRPTPRGTARASSYEIAARTACACFHWRPGSWRRVADAATPQPILAAVRLPIVELDASPRGSGLGAARRARPRQRRHAHSLGRRAGATASSSPDTRSTPLIPRRCARRRARSFTCRWRSLSWRGNAGLLSSSRGARPSPPSFAAGRSSRRRLHQRDGGRHRQRGGGSRRRVDRPL
jgi:hypothetical protein